MTITEKAKRSGEKLRQKKPRRIIKCIACLLLGFVLGTGSVLEGLRPFGVAAVAVSKKRYFLFTALGAAAGALLYGLNGMTARYLCAVVLAALGALVAAAFEVSVKPAFSVSVSFFAVLLTGLVLDVRTDAAATQYILTLGEAILAGGAAFFFHRSLSANVHRLRWTALPLQDVICLTVSASVVLMNLSALKIGVVCPARIAAVLLVLCATRFFGAQKGVVLALAFGFALSLADVQALFTVGALAFSVTVGALFLPLSAFAVGAGFLVSLAFFCIAAGESALPLFIDGAVGTLAFVLLPMRLQDRLEELADRQRDEPSDGSLRQSLVLKLRVASSAMAAVSESVEQVREKINELTRRDHEALRDTVSEEEYLRRELVWERTNRIRMVASDQFFSIADMLEDLAFEFDEAEIFNASASSRIRALLSEYEIYPLNISVIEDQYSRMRVEILADGGAVGLDNPRLSQEIGKICARYFERGRLTYFKNETMLSFTERPGYRLSVGFAQHSAEGHLCGDTVKVMQDGRGHSILMISDGMGKGSRAALDGAMGAGLLAKLIHAGFGFDSALKVVNCALLVKSNDESLATLDIANVDLFTGKCELLKAGAPAGYILKDGAVSKCELTSMPAGILRGIEFARRTAVLTPGASLVLMSDGVSEIGEEALYEQFGAFALYEPQECADRLIAAAKERCDPAHMDDMSVIVARLEENEGR